MLPRVTSSSGCCTLQHRSRSRCNPYYISELHVLRMQRKHFKGFVQPTASRGPATVCLILWILAGSGRPRKFLSPLSGVASSVARIPVVVPWVMYDYFSVLFNFYFPVHVLLCMSLNNFMKRWTHSVIGNAYKKTRKLKSQIKIFTFNSTIEYSIKI